MTTPGRLEPARLPAAFAAACKFTTPLVLRAVHRVTGAVRTHALGQPFALLGRAKGAGIHLDDPSVSQCHAYLQFVDGVLHCLDLGSRTGVVWDDGSRGRGCVYPGQTLQIGVFDVRLAGDADPDSLAEADELGAEPERDASPLSVLEVHSPGGPDGHFSLDRPITLIGRHPNCNLRFLDEGISYFQCALVRTHDGVWCIDLFSRKGTALNGRATRLARLNDGDLIELGKVSLVFHDGTMGQALALNGPPGAHAVAPAVVSQNGANALAAALNPLREMMEQFQQSFVTMARMFATMQQEHTAMMCEQMRQIQELMRESRATQKPAAPGEAAAPPSAPALAPPPTPGPKLPTPKPTQQGPEAEALADAHTWFLDRMAKLGQPQPPAPKRG